MTERVPQEVIEETAREVLEDIIRRRLELAKQRDQIDAEIKDLNALALVVMENLGIKTYKGSDGSSSLTVCNQESGVISRSLLHEALLRRGWLAEDIAALLEEVTVRRAAVVIQLRRTQNNRREG